jgi:HK97 family phage major capsid protein
MSTADLRRLIDEQNRVWNRMQEIRQRAADEGRDWSAEERANWDEAETRLSQVSEDIDRLERHARLEAVDRRGQVEGDPAPQNPEQRDYDAAFWAFARGGMSRLTPEQRDLVSAQYSETRALNSGVGPAGGYTVPEGFRNVITETMKAYGGLLGIATVLPTDSGQDLPWPTNDDTANEGEIIGENTQVSEQDISFGSKKLQAHTFTSKIVRVPFQLLQDTGINLEGFLGRKLGERIGRRAARAFTQGTGVDQPQGITVGITTGKTGAGGQTTSVTYNDLVDLEHSVDPAYRLNGRYLMHDLTLKAARKLVDGQQRPLFLPVPAPGFPATINGWPYTLDNSMPEMAANARSIVFGDIRAGYLIRTVLGIQLLRLEERYADFLQVGFLAFSRMDAMIDDGAAIRAYVNAAS